MKGRLAIRLCAKYCPKVFRTTEQRASAASGVSPMQVAAAADGRIATSFPGPSGVEKRYNQLVLH